MNRPTTLVILFVSLSVVASCNGGSGGTDGGGGSTGGNGGQGGIDNLCLSEGQSCGTTGPTCCGGLMCCYGSNGQASCVPGSCSGSGGAGGNQTYSCGSDTCTVGESFCYAYTPGTAGQTGRSCQLTPAACASTPASCACLCPPSSNAAFGCVPVGMGAGNYCLCSETGGGVTVTRAGS
jgi:hypothetical protein